MLPITLITDNSSVDLLLNKFCDPYTSLGIGLPDSLQNKSLIVCYDKNKALIHMAFYYNNSFIVRMEEEYYIRFINGFLI